MYASRLLLALALLACSGQAVPSNTVATREEDRSTAVPHA
jgi:hypothetical protein